MRASGASTGTSPSLPDGRTLPGMQTLSITWLGHSTFIVRTPGGKRLLFDPWLSSNPSCPDSMKKPSKVDLILASHGHFDHLEDLVACARESGAPVVGIFELCDWLTRKGIAATGPMNKGGRTAEH